MALRETTAICPGQVMINGLDHRSCIGIEALQPYMLEAGECGSN